MIAFSLSGGDLTHITYPGNTTGPQCCKMKKKAYIKLGTWLCWNCSVLRGGVSGGSYQ